LCENWMEMSGEAGMRPAAILVLLVTAACNDPGFQGVYDVREADAGTVGSCTYVSNIRGTPSVYGPVLGSQGISYTRNQVLDEARQAGANTVVFDKVNPGEQVYELRATAYRC
jgi:hypothetical protein